MENHRIFGLDLCRILAISLLLLANVLNSFQLVDPSLAQFAPILGFLSLEVFFVLSGFLLGKSLYGVFMSDGFSARDAIVFLKQKMMRILPLYWLILLVNIGIAYVMDYAISNPWQYFFLLQNFFKPIPNFFPESWGLPVIVFATLMFVFLLTGLSRIIQQRHKPTVFLLATIGLIMVFLWTKWLYHTQNQITDIARWDGTLKTVAVYRFDSVYIGVLFSILFLQLRAASEKIKWILAFLGGNGVVFLALGINIFQVDIESHAAFWNIFYLPLTALVLGCFVPLLASWQSAPGSIQRFASFLSRSTYSIYLVHFSIVLLFAEHWMLTDFSDSAALWRMNAVYVCCSIVLGVIIHLLIEKRLERIVRR